MDQLADESKAELETDTHVQYSKSTKKNKVFSLLLIKEGRALIF